MDDRDGARAILTQACESDDAAACRTLLAVLEDSYADEDEVAARQLAERLCDTGDGLACVMLARYAQRGDGGDINQPQQREALLKACELGYASSCMEAGKMINAGEGGPQDKQLARDLATRGCAKNDPIACQYSGGFLMDLAWEQEDDAAANATFGEARVAFTRACDLGDSYSCTALADMMLEGQGGDVDRAGAIELLDKACGLNFYQCPKRLEADEL